MKTLLIFATALLLSLAGCSLSPNHTRSSSLDIQEDKTVFQGQASTIWHTDPGPEALARARLWSKMSESFTEGKFREAKGWFIVGFQNNRQKGTLIIPNPEIPGYAVKLQPRGDFDFLQLKSLPPTLLVFNKYWRLEEELKIDQKNLKTQKFVNGMKIDIMFVFYD